MCRGCAIPVGEDSQLYRVALGQQVLLVHFRALHVHLDVHVGSYTGPALGLHHNGADVIDQNGRARDLVAGLELLQQVGRRVLEATNLCINQSIK